MKNNVFESEVSAYDELFLCICKPKGPKQNDF